ncbi:protein DOG1-like 2 [Iris pallida]|uniref:Protein DOG1-like 2 n=1 Tax=Iris pallida TaxID=29817 RepID=A0AAX6HMD2_IRIPA|nr:protein DOG1-like 2 [Iris pallida]
MDSACLYDSWIQNQRKLRDDLSTARTADFADQTRLRSLVSRAVDLYDSHYRARSQLSRSDPIAALLPASSTPLEGAAHWISGWRPNVLIHLLYTESGLRFESHLQNFLIGSRSGDIGDISPAQLAATDELQRRTVRREIEIDEELGEVQAGPWGWDPFPPSDSDLDGRLERVVRVVVRADELRMRTLRAVVGILEPLQAVDLLVAAADFEVGISGLGAELHQDPIGSTISDQAGSVPSPEKWLLQIRK